MSWVTTAIIVKIIYKMVFDNGELRVHKLADTVDITKNTVHSILTKILSMRKLCARWLPRLLTMEQNQCCEDVSIKYLALFRRNETEFLRMLTTMDKIWVYHFTPETTEQSEQWTEAGKSTPKQAKRIPSTGKVMASVFLDARGIIFIGYLQ